MIQFLTLKIKMKFISTRSFSVSSRFVYLAAESSSGTPDALQQAQTALNQLSQLDGKALIERAEKLARELEEKGEGTTGLETKAVDVLLAELGNSIPEGSKEAFKAQLTTALEAYRARVQEANDSRYRATDQHPEMVAAQARIDRLESELEGLTDRIHPKVKKALQVLSAARTALQSAESALQQNKGGSADAITASFRSYLNRGSRSGLEYRVRTAESRVEEAEKALQDAKREASADRIEKRKKIREAKTGLRETKRMIRERVEGKSEREVVEVAQSEVNRLEKEVRMAGGQREGVTRVRIEARRDNLGNLQKAVKRMEDELEEAQDAITNGGRALFDLEEYNKRVARRDEAKRKLALARANLAKAQGVVDSALQVLAEARETDHREHVAPTMQAVNQAAEKLRVAAKIKIFTDLVASLNKNARSVSEYNKNGEQILAVLKENKDLVKALFGNDVDLSLDPNQKCTRGKFKDRGLECIRLIQVRLNALDPKPTPRLAEDSLAGIKTARALEARAKKVFAV